MVYKYNRQWLVMVCDVCDVCDGVRRCATVCDCMRQFVDDLCWYCTFMGCLEYDEPYVIIAVFATIQCSKGMRANFASRVGRIDVALQLCDHHLPSFTYARYTARTGRVQIWSLSSCDIGALCLFGTACDLPLRYVH